MQGLQYDGVMLFFEQFLCHVSEDGLHRATFVVEVFVAGVLGAAAAARSRTALKHQGSLVEIDRQMSSS